MSLQTQKSCYDKGVICMKNNNVNNNADILKLLQNLDSSTQRIVLAFVQGLETQKEINKNNIVA